MAEYILKSRNEAGETTKRLIAASDSVAILEAIRCEDHNSDLRLLCEGRLVAEKRVGFWCLEPEVLSAEVAAKLRVAVDPFTTKMGWAKPSMGRYS